MLSITDKQSTAAVFQHAVLVGTDVEHLLLLLNTSVEVIRGFTLF